MALKTVLTGVKPTGLPHIGNYCGAIRPALLLSRQPEILTYLFIADYHSFISVHNKTELNRIVYEVAATWLACGLDPQRTYFYRQSSIPEIFELQWILSCLTPKGLLNRAHAYKAKVQENEGVGKSDLDFGVNIGLFSYPVLMAADILMFQADEVPVGEDQIQHLEIARDLAQKFNRQFGEVFRLPKFVVQKQKLIPGLDGRKMSKSYDNHIPLFLESKNLRKLVMKIKTDSLPPEAPKDPESSIIFEIYKAVATEEQTVKFRSRYEQGLSWGEAKEELFNILDQELSHFRDEYHRWMAHQDEIDQLLRTGAERARAQAQEVLRQVRHAIGIDK